MMKKIVLGVAFILAAFGTKAQADYLNYSDYFDEVASIINRVQMSHQTAYPIAGTPVSDSCVSFMSKEMFLGDNGKAIYEAFNKNAASLPSLVSGGSLNKYCPRYAKMDQKQKSMVWVMVLTMMAHFESSCNIKAHIKGPNGTANGYYQLHKGKEQEYDGDLDFCLKNASTTGNAHKCTLAMLEKQYQKQGNELFSAKSYWDVLRPSGQAQKADDIQRTIKKSSLCNPVIL